MSRVALQCALLGFLKVYQVIASFGYLQTRIPVVGPGAFQHQSKGHTLPCHSWKGPMPCVVCFQSPRGFHYALQAESGNPGCEGWRGQSEIQPITWLWFWKAGAVPGCECYELESWQARMERTFLSPPTAALSFPFKLEWPHWLDTDALTPATCRSYRVWLDVPVNRICSVKCVNWPWAHGKCTRDLLVLRFSSRCLALTITLKRTEILLTS